MDSYNHKRVEGEQKLADFLRQSASKIAGAEASVLLSLNKDDEKTYTVEVHGFNTTPSLLAYLLKTALASIEQTSSKPSQN